MKPTIHEIINHVAEHYGITRTEANAIMRTPTHPATLRDDLAIAAIQGMLAHSTRYRPLNANTPWHEAMTNEAYQIADAALKERLK